MEKIFKDIISIDHVNGVLLVSRAGKFVFKEFASSFSLQEQPEKRDWVPLVEVLSGLNEADLVFERGNVYIRRFTSGYIIILMDILAPVAMVRLSCNLLLPALEKSGVQKGGFRRFLKI
jgi:hypothetical protein